MRNLYSAHEIEVLRARLKELDGYDDLSEAEEDEFEDILTRIDSDARRKKLTLIEGGGEDYGTPVTRAFKLLKQPA